MNLFNLEKAPDYEVRDWLVKELDLTDYQKRKMYDNEVLRWSPFKFYKRKTKKSNFLLRLTVLIFWFVYILLFICLPFKYIIDGVWGYSDKHLGWFRNWQNKIF